MGTGGTGLTRLANGGEYELNDPRGFTVRDLGTMFAAMDGLPRDSKR